MPFLGGSAPIGRELNKDKGKKRRHGSHSRGSRTLVKERLRKGSNDWHYAIQLHVPKIPVGVQYFGHVATIFLPFYALLHVIKIG